MAFESEKPSPESLTVPYVLPERRFPIDQLTDEQRHELCAVAETTVAQMSQLEPTVQSLAKLHIFNTLSQNPDMSEQMWERELRRIYDWSKEESVAAAPDNILPTIGIEVESKYNYFGPAMEETFDRFGIHHYDDMIAGRYVDEVAPKFAYSAHTTARLLHELVEVGAFPLVDQEDKKVVPKEVMLGLHVNIGQPGEITEEMLYYTDAGFALGQTNSLFSVAFASPSRIRRRGRTMLPSGLQMKGAHESGKVGRKKEVNDDVFEPEEDTGLTRIELRAMEVRESSVYRMLVEVQRVMAAYFSHVKKVNNLALTEQETVLAESWPVFNKSVEETLTAYSDFFYDTAVIDNRLSQVADLMESTDIQSVARALIANYARQIGAFLKDSSQEAIEESDGSSEDKNDEVEAVVANPSYLPRIGVVEGEIREVGGRKYEAVATGYSEKEYFAHSTSEKGPGPGWDSRWGYMDRIAENEGRTELSDEPYVRWVEVA